MASVDCPPEVLAKLRTWSEMARRQGLGHSLASALREMGDRLRADPESWGDPQWDYSGLRLTHYQRYGSVLIERYTVHIDGTPVFVRQVLQNPGSPLAEAAE